MQFSLSTEYAIHGMIYLALKPRRKVTLVGEIARAQGVSETYLAKVLQQLARSGLVVSYRGAKGGFALASTPENVTLRQIVEAVEGSSPLFYCLEDRRNCKLGDDCPVRKAMTAVEEQMLALLERTSLQDLVTSMQAEKDKTTWLTRLFADQEKQDEQEST